MEIYNIIYYIDRKKDKTISSEVMHKSITFSILHYILGKKSNKLEMGKNYLDIMKAIMKCPQIKTATTTVKKLKVFISHWEQDKDAILSTCVQYSTGILSQNN